MPNGHNNIRRLAHRAAEEIKASSSIGRACGFSEGINSFRAKIDIQVMNHNGYAEPPKVRDRLIQKHEALMGYLEQLMGDYADSYDYIQKLNPVPEGMGNRIWICWWQGLNQAPEIVKACINSIRQNAAGRDVIIITKQNVFKYTEIPNWILDMARTGSISKTHISDLLRLEILARYGGIWLDATFFCCRPLSNAIYSAPMFSIKRPDYLHASIASGYFANYSLGCDEAHRFVFAAIRDMWIEYWRRSDFLIDYLLTDYLIVMAQRHCPAVADAFDSIRPNNPNCDELFKVLNKPYDESRWQGLNSDTDLFKLTWKKPFRKITAEGIGTFYSALLKGGLLLKSDCL